MILILMVMSYLLTMGFLTMSESKILGIMQNSVSILKMSLLGVYHFILDFLKVLFKGEGSSKIMPYFGVLVLVLLLMVLSYLTLMLGFLIPKLYSKILMSFLILDSLILILKIFLLESFKHSFMKLGVYSIKYLYVILEGVLFYIIFGLLMVLNSKGYAGGFTLWVFLMGYTMVLLKLFSTPFDYFEIESELVGGGVLEIQSIGFLLWSLVEYGLILNNSLFVTYLGFLVFSFGGAMWVPLMVGTLISILLISGVLVSMKLVSVSGLLFLSVFLMNALVFFIVVLM